MFRFGCIVIGTADEPRKLEQEIDHLENMLDVAQRQIDRLRGQVRSMQATHAMSTRVSAENVHLAAVLEHCTCGATDTVQRLEGFGQ